MLLAFFFLSQAAFTKTKQESQTTKKDNASKAQTLEPGQVLNIDKPPHKRSKKPLKRIEIIDVTDDSEKSKIEDMEQEEPTYNKMEVDNKETGKMAAGTFLRHRK